ncbi:MAG: peptidoglycan DD-metalloendopeptidase family protein [Anaerolineae bacterium]|jgi:murein DD-endopeptidase MepM/ murein hydrolase activator NlpD|nr:peptidoglycan DD-metalloendopeptidase family protein [Anaerolineae bacterium]
MATPYDGKVAIWHWKGDSIAEETIEDLVKTIKKWAPAITQVWVKTSDGEDWQGEFDTDRDLAIDSVASVDKWVRILSANGMEFHAWAVVKGDNITEEADRVIEVCNRPGVKSMVLDIEPFSGFWTAGREPIRPLMTRIRRGVGGRFHIGMAVDPRPWHKDSIFPEEWRPFVNSVHLQLYWETFQRPVREVLKEGFDTWKDYGLPVFPVLPGSAERGDMNVARVLSVKTYKATGISWWRFGVIGPVQFPAINHPVVPDDGDDEDPVVQGRYGIEVVVTPDDARYRDGAFGGQNADDLLSTFRGTWGWTTKYKRTAKTSSQVWARWDPQFVASGWYEVSAFVPNRHATTRLARYKLHGTLGSSGELEIPVDQSRYRNVWVPLGVYQFDANDVKAGVVFLNDLTGEPNREIALDALRWRQVIGIIPTEKYLADGYDSPVGTAAQRRASDVWPGEWFDATGFARRYRIGTPGEAYHTGVDLNLNEPFWDADAHSPIYAAASGVVTYADRLPGWGNVIVIRHDPLISAGEVLYGRYAHVEDIRISVGDRVVRGQMICKVGDAGGLFPYHLHYDLSPTAILESQPWHWPKLDRDSLLLNYIDPLDFTRKHRPTEP